MTILNEQVLPPLAAGAPRKVVILLHGLGDSGAGLIDLGRYWRAAFPQVEFVAPDAPYPCDMAPYGFQWFSMQTRTLEAIEAGVRVAAPVLNAYIDHVLQTRKLKAADVALLGFSQGAMMSLFVAPRRTESFAGILAYSGALVGGESLGAEKKSAPPVLLVHGDADEVVPFTAFHAAVHGLKQAQIPLQYEQRPGMGHTIDEEALAIGAAFLRKVFGVG